MPRTIGDNFYTLSPDRVLDNVEAALHLHFSKARATGKAFALNSLENRVYEIEMEHEIQGEKSVVAKFYRPGRWSKNQILEEHAFVEALAKAEVPVVSALTKVATTDDGIFFAVYPKIRGRLKDEPSGEELRQLGRLLARLHSVGERFRSKYRMSLTVDSYGTDSLQHIAPFIDENFRTRYEDLCHKIFDRIRAPLKATPVQSLHGDCHPGNILWNESGPFFLDFDDMLVGPPVQDMWMIVRGRSETDLELRDELITGYESMRDFDRSTLSLVESLRALRMIHFSAWIARRWEDPSFPQLFTRFGTQEYWIEEMQQLEQTLGPMDHC